jgi:N4-gp56 family major capsid protein
MALTNLATTSQGDFTLWKKDAIRVFRENLFFKKMMGKDENNVVQYIDELKKTDTGTKAMIGLIPDLAGNGVVGDNELDGREESMDAFWLDINADLHRNAVKSKGKKADRQAVFKMRSEARDRLMRWKANMVDELLILTASGISYSFNTDGSTRGGSGDPLTSLDFAADVVVPSSNRHFNYTGSALAAGDTSTITSSFVPKYGMVVDLMAEARTRGIKPIKVGGQDHYVYLCHPKHFAQLKKDADFRDAIINAGERGKDNAVFTGATVTMDGLIIHTNNKVFNTLGAASGSKWGSGSTVNGTRSLLMGAQALAFADITDNMEWEEEPSDYKNRYGIAISNFYGLLKPQFQSHFDSDTVQDFGVMAVNSYIA